jgi:prephenate dehydrogenase
MRIQTLTIVGVGLIGGSIGLAARRCGFAERITGVGRRPSSLLRALSVGAVDDVTEDLQAALGRTDLAVFCTPVNVIAQQILSCASAYPSCALITDAGSTKAQIVRSVEGHLPEGVLFAGSHPLAGSEKSGPEHADADLFCDRLVIVTRTDATPADASARVAEFWEYLGARIMYMTPEAHDLALARTSHLPHLLAAALANSMPEEFRSLTATGFRDTTRVAAGDPELWTAIFAQNRQPLLSALDTLETKLSEFRTALNSPRSDELHNLLAHAKKVRDDLGS